MPCPWSACRALWHSTGSQPVYPCALDVIWMLKYRLLCTALVPVPHKIIAVGILVSAASPCLSRICPVPQAMGLFSWVCLICYTV